MGFGGILAAMAQGLGTGMVKVADEGWKKAADERKFKFYADENEKGRAHDFALNDRKFEHEKQMEDIKTRNAISLMAHKARMGAKSSVNKDNINRFNDIKKAIETGEQQILAINKAIDDAAGNEKEIARLNSIKAGIQKEIQLRRESSEFYELGQNSGLGDETAMQHYISSGGFVPEKYKPKQEPIVEIVPTVEKPNMINANDEGALKKAQDDIFSRKIQDMSRKQTEQYGNNPYSNFMKHHYNR
ncbi:TPA: hypothetical protein QB189_002393 [Pasteurella multocida]|nr:hypothetical protein [Pasteurella multocida]